MGMINFYIFLSITFYKINFNSVVDLECSKAHIIICKID